MFVFKCMSTVWRTKLTVMNTRNVEQCIRRTYAQQFLWGNNFPFFCYIFAVSAPLLVWAVFSTPVGLSSVQHPCWLEQCHSALFSPHLIGKVQSTPNSTPTPTLLPLEVHAGNVRSFVVYHAGTTLHRAEPPLSCSLMPVLIQYAGHHLQYPLLSTTLAQLGGHTEWTSPSQSRPPFYVLPSPSPTPHSGLWRWRL